MVRPAIDARGLQLLTHIEAGGLRLIADLRPAEPLLNLLFAFIGGKGGCPCLSWFKLLLEPGK